MNKLGIIFLVLIWNCSAMAGELSAKCCNKKITIYVKEHCVYCIKLKSFLNNHKLSFDMIEISQNKMLQQWLLHKTKAYTVPYVFLDGVYIGGYTDFLKKCTTVN